MNNNRNISTFSPFITFCQHVIPLAYDESMSYYETLCALRDYLVNTVIPAVNNNADAVTELQESYTNFISTINDKVKDLENYIDNYFKNLDVQTEINNKLDEMSQSGELTEIIGQYLELNSVLAFNTRSDLKNANNLNIGSFTYCYGKDTYNDGYGAFYKIRESINTDVADDENLIALTNYPNLIAEKMPDNYLKDINDTLTSQINTINTTTIPNIQNDIIELDEKIENYEKTKITLVIGDSYTDDSSSARQLRDGAESWVNTFKNYTNLNVINLADSGSGFVATGDRGTTFLSQIQNWTNENENLKTNVESIIIYGGINDIDKSHISEIESAFNTFASYINNNYQKSNKLLFYFNLPNRLINNSELTILNNVINKAISLSFTCFKACGWLGGKNGECFASDNYHPNNKGSQRIFECVNSLINNGKSPCIPVTLSNMMLDYPSPGALQPNEYTINSNLYYYPTLNRCEGVANIKLTGHNVNSPGTSAQWSLKSDLTIAALPFYVPCSTNYSTNGGDNHKCVMFGNSGYENNYMKLWISIDNNSNTTVTFNTLAIYINYIFC